MIHIYCGDGKGKTTAATGLILRALGTGKKVVLVRFLKSGRSGEVTALRNLQNIEIIESSATKKFTFQMNDDEKRIALCAQDNMLKSALECEYDMLVLDEVMGAWSCNMINKELLKSTVDNFDADKELVMTGRDPHEYFVDRADYVSQIKCIKHPYTKGTPAREGVEF